MTPLDDAALLDHRPGKPRFRLNRRAMLLSGTVGAVGAVGASGAMPLAAAEPAEARGRPGT